MVLDRGAYAIDTPRRVMRGARSAALAGISFAMVAWIWTTLYTFR